MENVQAAVQSTTEVVVPSSPSSSSNSISTAHATEVPTSEVGPLVAEMALLEVNKSENINVNDDQTIPDKHHHFWKSEGGHLEYTSNLIPNEEISKDRVEKSRRFGIRRFGIHGAEVRDLGDDHVLSGEQGLFATKKFRKFDILGEYTGYVVDQGVGGSYVATLENDYSTFNSLGVNAATCGNELRFINGYQNIEFVPNLEMKTVYISTHPHVVLICTADIDIGNEFLLDYGVCYVTEYMTPKSDQP